MDSTLLGVIGVVTIALIFDVTNGFHDSANSVAIIVATRVLRPRWAVVWAAFFNFIAFLIFGTKVADTVGETVHKDQVGIPLVFSALVGAIAWNLATWWLGLPSSSSHALVGGLVGAGIAAAGTGAIEWGSVVKVLVFIVVSPLIGFVLAAVLMFLLRQLERHSSLDDDSRAFKGLQLFSSAALSIGHGSNDAQKTMGVIAALLVATGHLQGGGDKLTIPLWVVLAAHAAIAIGTLSGGWNVVRTMGLKITTVRPAGGVAAESAAAIAVIGSTLVGAPVSTTHTVAGAVTGVGVAAKGQDVSWSVARSTSIAWVLTLPPAAIAAAIVYGMTRLATRISVTLVVILGIVAVGLFYLAWRDAAGPGDISRELDERDRDLAAAHA